MHRTLPIADPVLSRKVQILCDMCRLQFHKRILLPFSLFLDIVSRISKWIGGLLGKWSFLILARLLAMSFTNGTSREDVVERRRVKTSAGDNDCIG